MSFSESKKRIASLQRELSKKRLPSTQHAECLVNPRVEAKMRDQQAQYVLGDDQAKKLLLEDTRPSTGERKTKQEKEDEAHAAEQQPDSEAQLEELPWWKRLVVDKTLRRHISSIVTHKVRATLDHRAKDEKLPPQSIVIDSGLWDPNNLANRQTGDGLTYQWLSNFPPRGYVQMAPRAQRLHEQLQQQQLDKSTGGGGTSPLPPPVCRPARVGAYLINVFEKCGDDDDDLDEDLLLGTNHPKKLDISTSNKGGARSAAAGQAYNHEQQTMTLGMLQKAAGVRAERAREKAKGPSTKARAVDSKKVLTSSNVRFLGTLRTSGRLQRWKAVCSALHDYVKATPKVYPKDFLNGVPYSVKDSVGVSNYTGTTTSTTNHRSADLIDAVSERRRLEKEMKSQKASLSPRGTAGNTGLGADDLIKEVRRDGLNDEEATMLGMKDDAKTPRTLEREREEEERKAVAEALAKMKDSQDSALLGYQRDDITDARYEYLQGSQMCRTALQRIYNALEKDINGRLTKRGFVIFVLDLINLYMPSFHCGGNVELAEDEWICRGTTEKPDFPIFHRFFFDFPFMVCRNEHLSEETYSEVWDFTYQKIFVENFRNADEYDRHVLSAQIMNDADIQMMPKERRPFMVYRKAMQKTKKKERELHQQERMKQQEAERAAAWHSGVFSNTSAINDSGLDSQFVSNTSNVNLAEDGTNLSFVSPELQKKRDARKAMKQAQDEEQKRKQQEASRMVVSSNKSSALALYEEVYRIPQLERDDLDDILDWCSDVSDGDFDDEHESIRQRYDIAQEHRLARQRKIEASNQNVSARTVKPSTMMSSLRGAATVTIDENVGKHIKSSREILEEKAKERRQSTRHRKKSSVHRKSQVAAASKVVSGTSFSGYGPLAQSEMLTSGDVDDEGADLNEDGAEDDGDMTTDSSDGSGNEWLAERHEREQLERRRISRVEKERRRTLEKEAVVDDRGRLVKLSEERMLQLRQEERLRVQALSSVDTAAIYGTGGAPPPNLGNTIKAAQPSSFMFRNRPATSGNTNPHRPPPQPLPVIAGGSGEARRAEREDIVDAIVVANRSKQRYNMFNYKSEVVRKLASKERVRSPTDRRNIPVDPYLSGSGSDDERRPFTAPEPMTAGGPLGGRSKDPDEQHHGIGGSAPNVGETKSKKTTTPMASTQGKKATRPHSGSYMHAAVVQAPFALNEDLRSVFQDIELRRREVEEEELLRAGGPGGHSTSTTPRRGGRKHRSPANSRSTSPAGDSFAHPVSSSSSMALHQQPPRPPSSSVHTQPSAGSRPVTRDGKQPTAGSASLPFARHFGASADIVSGSRGTSASSSRPATTSSAPRPNAQLSEPKLRGGDDAENELLPTQEERKADNNSNPSPNNDDDDGVSFESLPRRIPTPESQKRTTSTDTEHPLVRPHEVPTTTKASGLRAARYNTREKHTRHLGTPVLSARERFRQRRLMKEQNDIRKVEDFALEREERRVAMMLEPARPEFGQHTVTGPRQHPTLALVKMLHESNATAANSMGQPTRNAETVHQRAERHALLMQRCSGGNNNISSSSALVTLSSDDDDGGSGDELVHTDGHGGIAAVDINSPEEIQRAHEAYLGSLVSLVPRPASPAAAREYGVSFRKSSANAKRAKNSRSPRIGGHTENSTDRRPSMLTPRSRTVALIGLAGKKM